LVLFWLIVVSKLSPLSLSVISAFLGVVSFGSRVLGFPFGRS
jgi:hypothetical protein